MAKLLSPALALLVLILCSCQRFGPQAELQVVIPEPPDSWARAFADLSYNVTFPDCTGAWQTVAVADVSQPPLISCSKAGNTPILAYPVAGHSEGFLRPAGALYPADCVDQGDQVRLVLSWKTGCLALIFMHLAERGFDTSLVNAPRLASYVGRHADPWGLDLDAIAEKLIHGDFSAYDIDLLPSRDVTLKPGAGEWFLESPFSPSHRLGDGELLTLPGLTLGMHALFRAEGGMIRLSVGEGETVIGQQD